MAFYYYYAVLAAVLKQYSPWAVRAYLRTGTGDTWRDSSGLSLPPTEDRKDDELVEGEGAGGAGGGGGGKCM